MDFFQAAGFFLIALVTSAGLTAAAVKFSGRLGLIDQPRAGELQRFAVPRTGGYAMLLAFVVAIGVSLLIMPRESGEYDRLLAFGVGILVILPIALIDDLKRLGWVIQTIGHSLVAVLTMVFGVLIESVASPFGGLILLPIWIAIPFTYLWIVGMINTINLNDTIDGLGAGVAAIAATVLFFRSLELGQYSIAVLPLALVGACAGFLVFNFHPAKIIMGTAGSMVLGYSLAVLAIIGGAKIATALMVLALPIGDVVAVIIQRWRARRSPFKGGDSAHLPHRLTQMGWSPRQITIAAYGVCGLFGWLALSLPGAQKLMLFIAVAVALLLLLITMAVRAKLYG